MDDIKRIKALIKFKLLTNTLVLILFIMIIAFTLVQVKNGYTIRLIIQLLFASLLSVFTFFQIFKFVKLLKYVNYSNYFKRDVMKQINRRELPIEMKEGCFYIDSKLIGNHEVDRVSNLFFRPQDYHKYMYTVINVNRHPVIVSKRQVK